MGNPLHPRRETPPESRTAAHLASLDVPLGPGGEPHQRAGDGVPVLTTQQGIPVADG